eukprot:GHRQ01007296.1.p1 GENE.GHRQ01007296.1~~GHRQ01007296.1.p1  ORF type:complete len:196 (+),score=40.98 GHRQ01007296.1:906-1493(+)
MAPVTLNVYDLTSQMNSWTYWCGVGVFHAGVEVYGIEYAYGGHDYDVSGIFATRPREAPGAAFRESIHMGETDLTAAQVQHLVQQMGHHYKGNKYHLLQLNCNHFASDMCLQLTAKPVPSWVSRLAGLAVMLHCFLPGSWVPPLQTPSAMPEVQSNVPVARGKRRAITRDASRQKLLDSPLSDEPPPLDTSASRV